MKRISVIIALFLICTVLCGCFKSSPSSDKTIIINVGEPLAFSATTVATEPWMFCDIEWDIPDKINSMFERYSSPLKRSTAYFIPTKEYVGINNISCRAMGYVPGDGLYALGYAKWEVIVRGVTMTDSRSVFEAGQTSRIEAQVYPTGNFNYEWYINGTLVGTGKTYDFTPGIDDTGMNEIEVRAKGSHADKPGVQVNYSYSRLVHVPAVSFRTSSYVEVSACAPAKDGGFVIAGNLPCYYFNRHANHNPSGFCYDAYAARIDSNGSLLWEKPFGGTGMDYFYSIKQTSDGGFIAAGISDSSGIPGSEGGKQAYIVKTDEQGSVVWERAVGLVENGAENNVEVIETGDHDFILGISDDYSLTVIKVDRNGDKKWEWESERLYIEEPFSIIQSGDGCLVSAGGARKGLDNGGWDSFFNDYYFKLDLQGTLVLENNWILNKDENITSIFESADGNMILAGWQRVENVSLSNFNEETGKITWVSNNGQVASYKIIGNNLHGKSYITQTANEDLVFASSPYFLKSAHVFKTDKTGDILYQSYVNDELKKYSPKSIFIMPDGSTGLICVTDNPWDMQNESKIHLLKLN